MDMSFMVMWIGFILAAYSVVGNDVIQTLGTFLSSNEKTSWLVLWGFAASILTATLLYSWVVYGGDVSYQRLIGDAPKYSLSNPKYPFPSNFDWYYILPPLVLMMVTRAGIPVSTSFLILTFFKPKGLAPMLIKSMFGYLLAFTVAILVYLVVCRLLDKKFADNPIKAKEKKIWTVLQWCSTGFLWSMWLIQDFANIYVYLPRQLDFLSLLVSLVVLVAMLGYIFYSKGGAIQGIVKAKYNTTDIRSATIIDFIYGLVLLYFKELNSTPMSTTWVFIGLLAGREIAIRLRVSSIDNKLLKNVGGDFAKALFGLFISVALVMFINWVNGQDVMADLQQIATDIVQYDYADLFSFL